MIPDAVDRELSREPFAPQRLHLSNGRRHDVTNPGLAFIVHGALYLARTDRPHTHIMDDCLLVSLRHIVRIELIEPAA